jgi:ATP-dependent Clp protease ATP-binding subunit ClpA
MTSNAGSTDKDTGVGFNKTAAEVSKEKAMKALQEFLRPEFLGRVDEVVVFNPLTEENYAQIAALMLDEMREPLEEKAISFAYKDEALKLIAKKSFGHKLGGRDIRKVIREEIEDKLAEILVEKGEENVRMVCIGADGENLTVTAE